MKVTSRSSLFPLVLVPTAALALAACGSGGTAAGGPPTRSSSSAPSAAPSSAPSSAPPSTPSSATSSAPGGTSVSLKSLEFAPESVTVKAGTPLMWRNDEPITHTVTSGSVTGADSSTGLRSDQKPDGTFDARLAKQGDTFSHTFAKPGTYSYYCDIHKGMNAKVVVTN